MSESIIYEVTTTNSIHKLGMYGIWGDSTFGRQDLCMHNLYNIPSEPERSRKRREALFLAKLFG